MGMHVLSCLRRLPFILSLLVAWLSCVPLRAIVVDSRYFPLYDRVFSRSLGRSSRVGADLFFTTAQHARNMTGYDDLGIPELRGCFDQICVGKAIEAIGKTNPLSPQWQIASSIPWKMSGKIQSEGFGFTLKKSLGDYLGVGFSSGIMHVSSRIDFTLRANVQKEFGLDEGGILGLDRERRQALILLGLDAPQWSVTNMLDTDVYLRVGKIWEYQFKTRRIDVNGTVGCLIPTGQERDENNPASIPFGGDGHWGVYGVLNVDFELKEDLSLGCSAFAEKRLKKTKLRRLIVRGEPLFFGAVLGQSQVDPGYTAGFSPYLIIEEIREGLGCYAQYFYAHHMHDCWEDCREDGSVDVCLLKAQTTSNWVNEYFTFNVFYDFGKTDDISERVPRLSIAIDIPTRFLGAHDVSKTYQVSLGFEVYF